MAKTSLAATLVTIVGCFCVAAILVLCMILLLAIPSPSWPTREPQFVWWWITFGLIFLLVMLLLLGCDEPIYRSRHVRRDSHEEFHETSSLALTCLVFAMFIVIFGIVTITYFAAIASGDKSGTHTAVATANSTASLLFNTGAKDDGTIMSLSIIVLLVFLIVCVPLMSICICVVFVYDWDENDWKFRRLHGSAAPVKHEIPRESVPCEPDHERSKADKDDGEASPLLRGHSDDEGGSTRHRGGLGGVALV